jgi:single-stranded-DNA-specific exonuclease
MMMLCLLKCEAQVNFFLPHRVRDGYGLSKRIVERAAKNKYTLVITVDNGITAFEPARCARELGIDLIITDHHQTHNEIPDAFAVINPQQHDCSYPYKHLAGVGVAFKLLSLVFDMMGHALPEKVYELLMFGTVADVVPLTGENRFWVRHGLHHVNDNESMSLRVLKENVRSTKPSLSSRDIGFSIAPQINALGRLEDPRQGVKFLIGSDEQEVNQVGRVLHELNQARKLIEQSIVADIQSDIDNGYIDPHAESVIISSRSNWQPGVIGLAASRMVSQYHRPTFLFHEKKDGTITGSCRSIPGLNVFQALEQSRDMLTKFGGHAAAAGLSMPKEQLPAFKKQVEAYIAATLQPEDFVKKLHIDAMMTMEQVSKKLMADLRYLEPFGCANDQPVFYLQDVYAIEPPQLLKDVHVKCRVFADGIIKPVIFFNRPDIYDAIVQSGDRSFDMAVYVVENHWNGKTSIEFQGIDIVYKGEQ